MMYGYMKLPDETGIAHSEMNYLPSYRWEEIKGFTDQEVQKLERLLQNNAHLILQFAREGGFENASSF